MPGGSSEHGSLLSGNFGASRVSSQRKSTVLGLKTRISDLLKQIKSLTDGQDTKAGGPNSIEAKASNDTLNEMSRERELQKLREQGARAVENLRLRDAAFLDAEQKKRRLYLAGELAATKEIGDQRVKDAARKAAVEDEQLAIAREQADFDTANSTPAMITRRFIMDREKFRARAYWDVNHFRVGYGSDTTTSAGGAIGVVTKNTTVTLEGALRDLDRRIKEFQDAIKRDIGSADRFNAFNSQQQAALTSVAYNYGSLGPKGANIANIVRTGTTQQISDAIRKLAGHNGGINRARRNMEADLFLTPNAAIEADNQQQADQALQRQSELNTSIEQTNLQRKRETEEIIRQNALRDDALVQQQIIAAGERAVADLERQIAEKNANLKPYEQRLALTEAQIAATKQLAEDEARARLARELKQGRIDRVERPVSELTAERNALATQVDALRAIGDTAGAETVKGQIASLNEELVQAIDNAINLFQSLTPDANLTRTGIDTIIAGLRTARLEAQNFSVDMKFTAGEIQTAFSGSLSDSFKQFARDVAKGQNVFESFGRAALSFVASFIEKIADMGLQMLAFKAATKLGFADLAGGLNGVFGVKPGSSQAGNTAVGGAAAAIGQQAGSAAAIAPLVAAGGALGTAGVTLTTAGAQLISAASLMLASVAGRSIGLLGDVTKTIAANPGIFHSGGIVGFTSVPTRLAPPAWFENAKRFHTGGFPGLRPDEVPAILQRGEEVLAKTDVRHAFNGGKGSGGLRRGDHVSQVLAIGEEEIVKALKNASGERLILTHIRRNKETVREMLG